jgi:hypothetical protein
MKPEKRQKIIEAVKTVKCWVRENPAIAGVSLKADPTHQRNQLLAELVCQYLEHHVRLLADPTTPLERQVHNMAAANESSRIFDLLEAAYKKHQQAIGLEEDEGTVDR